MFAVLSVFNRNKNTSFIYDQTMNSWYRENQVHFAWVFVEVCFHASKTRVCTKVLYPTLLKLSPFTIWPWHYSKNEKLVSVPNFLNLYFAKLSCMSKYYLRYSTLCKITVRAYFLTVDSTVRKYAWTVILQPIFKSVTLWI